MLVCVGLRLQWSLCGGVLDVLHACVACFILLVCVFLSKALSVSLFETLIITSPRKGGVAGTLKT